MSGLQPQLEAETAGVDVQERGNSLRVATNTPHLVSLGCGRLSTAVTIHPIKQGRVTIGSNGSCDIPLQGTGVQPEHCRIENSNGVVTLYPVQGSTLVDGVNVTQPIRLSQGCMIGIGRSNYLRFNHPAEANLMKSVLPNTRISMAPIHFLSNEGYSNQTTDNYDNTRSNGPPTDENGTTEEQYKGNYQRDIDLADCNFMNADGHTNLEKELDMTYKELSKRKPPVAPRKMFRDFDQISNSSNSDQEIVARANTPPKNSGIMSKVSKFEYYVRNSQKTNKTNGNSQTGETISPKVFSSNSLTVNTPAKDVLVNKDVPSNFKNIPKRRIALNENNAIDSKNCSYTNVTVKNQVTMIDKKHSNGGETPIKVQNADRAFACGVDQVNVTYSQSSVLRPGQAFKPNVRIQAPSPSFNRNPVFNSPTTADPQVLNGMSNTGAEIQRKQAQLARLDDESQKFLEQARLEEILNMCAEYEKQISMGVPTTPTEKKTHNKIITNGSLPRGVHNAPNIVQSSDGYFRFDTGHNRADSSPHRVLPSPSPKPHSYENVQIVNYNTSPSNSQNGQHQLSSNQQYQSSNCQQNLTDSKNQQFNSHHSSYENFRADNQNAAVCRQENYVQNVRQFPITELSSPVMIRKIARNAQNSSNYVGSYDRNIPKNGEITSDFIDLRQGEKSGKMISPYENLSAQFINNVRGNVAPNSPNSHSPRTRIKTTYAHKNVVSPQHFVFPSPPPLENDMIGRRIEKPRDLNLSGNHNNLMNEGNRCHGIERQLSLTEDIPMIDDTEFVNELEMRIAKLKPENRNVEADVRDLIDPDNVFGNHRRNFEEIRRDLIADIPELDEIHRDIDRNLAQCSKYSGNSAIKNSLNENLQKINEDLKDMQLVDDVFVAKDAEGEATESSAPPPCSGVVLTDVEIKVARDDTSSKLETLRCERKRVLSEIHKVKCRMADIRLQEDDILRELEMEKALLEGEYDSEMAILNLEQKKLLALQEKVKSFELEMQSNKDQQDLRQKCLKEKLEIATKLVAKLDKQFAHHDATLEELRNAQEVLDTERKSFEDQEFQDLEEEADWLAYREELQTEISALTQKIDEQKSRILNLRFETSNNLNMAVEETKSLQSDYVTMLNKIETHTTELQAIEEDIKNTVLEIGSEFADVDKRNSSMEERRSRIKSGDFSPPSSDNEDLNECFENRKKNLKEKLVSIDQMSRSMIVDLGEKRSIDDLLTPDLDRSLRSVENSPNKYIQNSASENSSPSCIERSCSEEGSERSPEKKESGMDSSPDVKDKKQGFWERNFDSLSRLKGKDKKLKGNTSRALDIMSQSLNENMFFNNENIESEYGSFEKCNSLRSSKKNKEAAIKAKSIEESSPPKSTEKASKIPTFASLGKIMRKDSFGKKSKEDKSVKSSNEMINNKENIDLNFVSTEDVDMLDSEQKGVKHRYVKNSKSGISENKYLSKCTKTSQQSISIPPEQLVSNSAEDLRRNSNNLFHNECRDSYADSLEEEVRIIDPVSGNTIQLCEVTKVDVMKNAYRKSAGDEGGRFLGDFSKSLTDNGKVPSQDDIDRISKVTLDSPLLANEFQVNSLGRRTIDSLREVERNRMAMLEEKGCQVMEDEREKISELKKRVQNETKLKWEKEQQKRDASGSDHDTSLLPANEGYNEDSRNASRADTEFTNTSILDETAADMSAEKLRHSQTDSYNSSACMEEEAPARGNPPASVRPLSQLSDMSSDTGMSGYAVEASRRGRRTTVARPRDDPQRPLTRYLPIDTDDLNLRQHIETAGHQVDLCPHIQIDSISCRGYLHKLGAKFHGWSKRWFVFDRSNKTLIYYSDKSEKKPRGGAYFQVIEEVYLDHLNVSRSPAPLSTFVLKTRQRRYYLMAPSGPAARIWIDVLFTGAQGYTEYMQ